MKTIIINNISGVDKTYAGQSILDTESYTLQTGEHSSFSKDSNLFADVGSGAVQIGNGTTYFDATTGWEWLTGEYVKAEITQIAGLNSKKIAAHTSTKPIIDGKTFYATWAGAGDDMTTGEPGAGPLAHVQVATANSEVSQDAFFHPDNGKVHIFDGYLQWQDAAPGDHICVEVRALPTTLQQAVNLDLVVDVDGWISYSTGGPGTGTHGFAATPSLIVRSFSKDGQWDYDTVNGLTPNFTNTGEYKISTDDKLVHRFVNHLPIIGNSYGMFALDSSEATEVPPGLYVRLRGITGANATGSLHITSAMMLWREVTGQP